MIEGIGLVILCFFAGMGVCSFVEIVAGIWQMRGRR